MDSVVVLCSAIAILLTIEGVIYSFGSLAKPYAKFMLRTETKSTRLLGLVCTIISIAAFEHHSPIFAIELISTFVALWLLFYGLSWLTMNQEARQDFHELIMKLEQGQLVFIGGCSIILGIGIGVVAFFLTK